MNRLEALIAQRLSEGESYRTMAQRATAAGHKISHGHINNLHRGLVQKAPDREMIAALAAALPASEIAVRRAVFLDWYGYDILEGVDYQAMVGAELTEQERQELDRMVQAWLAARRPRSDNGA